jgi:hypothetical protein
LTGVSSCKPIRQFNRFFLTRCPEEGPTRETEFAVYLPAISLDRYYRDLSDAAAGFPRREIARARMGDSALPIHHIGPLGGPANQRLLVVAGIHGNEAAGALAAPRILDDMTGHPGDYAAVEMHLIAPANPVGLGRGSRYNADGCDVNRDFGAFGTIEAAAIREVFDGLSPNLVLALHEGPHEGFFLIVARRAPVSLATTAVHAVAEAGIRIAARSNLGFRLRRPGIMYEGWFVTGGKKKLIRIGSLADYAHGRGIGTITTEGPFGSPNIEDRIRAQVIAVRAIAAAMAKHDAGASDTRRERTGDYATRFARTPADGGRSLPVVVRSTARP